jgi:hypothetical protein
MKTVLALPEPVAAARAEVARVRAVLARHSEQLAAAERRADQSRAAYAAECAEAALEGRPAPKRPGAITEAEAAARDHAAVRELLGDKLRKAQFAESEAARLAAEVSLADAHRSALADAVEAAATVRKALDVLREIVPPGDLAGILKDSAPPEQIGQKNRLLANAYDVAELLEMGGDYLASRVDLNALARAVRERLVRRA